jgi:hypothetical protein
MIADSVGREKPFVRARHQRARAVHAAVSVEGLTWARGPSWRRTPPGPVLGTVPAVSIVIDLVHLPALSEPHAIQRFDARVTANGQARIDCLDVTDFREELELHVSAGQRASQERR